MTTPRTRIEEGATEFERDLLRSWTHETPSFEARQNVIRVGIAGALAGTSSVATATGAAGGAIAEGLAPKAAAVSLLAIGKWIVTGAVVMSGAVVAMPYVRALATKPPPAALVSTPSPAPHERPAPEHDLIPPPSTPDTIDMPIAIPSVPTVEVSPDHAVPTSRAPHRTVAPAQVSAAAPARDEPPPAEKRATRELGEQVTSLDRARAALTAGDAAETIRVIDDYEKRFPNGSLLQEATVLRIEALLHQGKRNEAAELGAHFIAAHPNHPYAAKLGRLLGNGSNP